MNHVHLGWCLLKEEVLDQQFVILNFQVRTLWAVLQPMIWATDPNIPSLPRSSSPPPSSLPFTSPLPSPPLSPPSMWGYAVQFRALLTTMEEIASPLITLLRDQGLHIPLKLTGSLADQMKFFIKQQQKAMDGVQGRLVRHLSVWNLDDCPVSRQTQL